MAATRTRSDTAAQPGRGPHRDLRIDGRLARLAWRMTGVVLTLATLRLLYVHGPFAFGPIDVFQSALDVDVEESIPTWFSTMLLAVVAAIAALIALANSSSDRRGWFGFAVFLGLLSLDEVAGFHERVGLAMEANMGLDGWLWVIAGGLIVIGVGIVGARWLLALPKDLRRSIALAAVLYVSGALVIEAFAGAVLTDETTLLYDLSTLVEETLEMVAALVLLGALLRFAGAGATGVRIILGAQEPPPGA